MTVITALKQIGKSTPNYRYVEVPIEDDTELDQIREQMLKNAEESQNFFQQIPRFINTVTGRTSDILKSSEMEKLKKEKFDLVVFGLFVNDFQIGLAHHFGCPSVIISVMPAIKLIRDYAANPDELSAVPSMFIAGDGDMTFLQRCMNVVIFGVETVFINALDYFCMEPLYREHFGEKFPSYSEIKKNVSLVLVNQHFTQGTTQALVPAMQEFSGMHIKRKPDPLPDVTNISENFFRKYNFNCS